MDALSVAGFLNFVASFSLGARSFVLRLSPRRLECGRPFAASSVLDAFSVNDVSNFVASFFLEALSVALQLRPRHLECRRFLLGATDHVYRLVVCKSG